MTLDEAKKAMVKFVELKTTLRPAFVDVILNDSIPRDFHDKCMEIEIQKRMNMVEVVRCRDCKYYLNSNEKCGLVDTRLRFYETDKVWAVDSFCSWGERKGR